MVKKFNEFKELQKKKGKKGFSMIELIIVIAIMAILVALIGTQLIPMLEKSREKRDLTTLDSCLTNFQSAVAECGVILDKGTSGNPKEYTIDDFDNSNAALGIKATFEEFAGFELTDLAGLFKSDASTDTGNGTSGKSAVTWQVDENGTISVVIGDLIASAAYSGKVSEKQ